MGYDTYFTGKVALTPQPDPNAVHMLECLKLEGSHRENPFIIDEDGNFVVSAGEKIYDYDQWFKLSVEALSKDLHS